MSEYLGEVICKCYKESEGVYSMQRVDEWIVRCRDCIDGANDGTLCTRLSILNPAKADPNGFCAWGKEK